MMTAAWVRLLTSIRWRLLKPTPPRIDIEGLGLITIGSRYGRKSFIPPKSDYGVLNVLSGGVGEDISFDVELASLYKCRIVLADPSKPAADHFEKVVNSLGKPACQGYSDSSRQPITSYNLLDVSSNSLCFYPLGLWNTNTTLNFYLPPDSSRDSSGSINGIHSYYKSSRESFEIDVITVKSLMADSGMNHLNILKLDIEGAGLEVIQQMFEDLIYPDQILIEMDEMHFPSFKSKFRAQKLFRLLKKNEYKLVFIDSCDFVYIQRDILE